MQVSVILVEPESSGNIGSTARAMKNFGVKDLILINPCRIDMEARSRAMHAWDIVKNAKKISSLDEVTGFDFLVGTTAKSFDSSTTRASMTPRELAEMLEITDAKIGLVFGRESRGLTNQELRKCDIVLTIPTDEEYKSMNLSHAVAVVLYELYGRKKPRRKADKKERDALIMLFSKLANSLDLRNPENAIKMFRNVISRAIISGSEAKGIAVVLKRCIEKLDEWSRSSR